MKPVIEINKLGKKYSIGKTERYLALRDTITNSIKNIFSKNKRTEDFWALQDIDLKIEQGERIGIIGKNGAGKSTLLKILSRVTWPTTGDVVIRGRLASLLEVGTGFHPELTGRENIYLNGSILGLKKKEITNQYDAIVDFSGVENFLDTPLKNYSSGMQLRLAFAVAAHLDPEILLIDEVLAVGDLGFQKKCIGKMEEISKQYGRTILFVSHNLAQLKHLCNSAVLLDHGQIKYTGKINDTIKEYTSSATIENFHWEKETESTSDHYIERAVLKKNNESPASGVKVSDKLSLEIVIRTTKIVRNSLIAIRVTNQENIPVYTTTSADLDTDPKPIEPGQHVYRISLPVDVLVPGKYSIVVSWNIPSVAELDKIENALTFDIDNEEYAGHILRDGRLGVIHKTIPWEKL